MTDKEFEAMLNGKPIKWSSGKDNEKYITGEKNPYRKQSKKLIENQRKKKTEQK